MSIWSSQLICPRNACLFHCRRKPEYPERIHTELGRTCRNARPPLRQTGSTTLPPPAKVNFGYSINLKWSLYNLPCFRTMDEFKISPLLVSNQIKFISFVKHIKVWMRSYLSKVPGHHPLFMYIENGKKSEDAQGKWKTYELISCDH